jgi:1-acyl-sn-glycerol-3-phosphate acyltransferase
MLSLGKLDLKEKYLSRLVTPEIDQLVASIPKPVGSFGYDPWGYNEDRFKLALGGAKWLYDKYFRVTAHGLENIPSSGRLLIIGNHSGQLPMDGVLVGVAAATNQHGPRLARAMIERFFPTVPWLGNYLNALGGVIGDPVNCTKMLEMEEAIIVFPEGVRGSGKLYKHRYQLQRFGNGFMHLAMNHNTPIVPVGIVGCEETMPAVANIKPLARLLGIPYVPVVPSLLPLPARVYLNFGKPMHFSCCVNEAEVAERVEQVKEELRRLIELGLQERTTIYK